MAHLVFKIMPAARNHFNAVNYNAKKEKKGSAQLIYFENFGRLQESESVSKKEFTDYLKSISSLNNKIKKPSFHAVISCAGREVAVQKLQEYAGEIMKNLGYGEQPMLMYAHNDTENNHVHIVSTRVDLKGKKINDSYEKKRANNALNAILNRHPGLEFDATIQQFKNYKFSTTAQHNLLFESMGYKVKADSDYFEYIKYGEVQGKIDRALVESAAEKNALIPVDKKRISQIKALINKYAKNYETELCQTQPGANSERNYTEQPKSTAFKSELTDFLKKNFGLEFIFFAGANKNTPYGYAIIDHSRQTVYKGSEIISLKELTTNNPTQHAIENAGQYYNNSFNRAKVYPTKQEQAQAPNEWQQQDFLPYDKGAVHLNFLNAIMGRAIGNKGNSQKKADDGSFKVDKRHRRKFH